MADAVSVPVLPDRFVEESLIGAGGTAVVFHAWDHRLGRTVAVKVFTRGSRMHTPEEIRDRELDATAALRAHPNVCTPIDSGFTRDGLPYVVVEHHPGGSLHDRIVARGPLDPSLVAGHGIRLAGVLASAHDLGLVHGDLKPANILLSEVGEPLLTDFSASAASDEVTGRTPLFVAPELAGSAAAQPSADVFALGRTLQLALYGFPSGVEENPTLDPDRAVSIVSTINLSPRRTRAVRRDDPLVRALESCVDPDPQRRPTALELARDLRVAQRAAGHELTSVPLVGGLHSLPLPEPDGPEATATADDRPPRPRRRGLRSSIVATAAVVGGLALFLLGGSMAGSVEGPASHPGSGSVAAVRPSPEASALAVSVTDVDVDGAACRALGRAVDSLAWVTPAVATVAASDAAAVESPVVGELEAGLAPAIAGLDRAAAESRGMDRVLVWILRDTLGGFVRQAVDGTGPAATGSGDARSFVAAGLAIAARGDSCGTDLRSEWIAGVEAITRAAAAH